MLGMRLAVLALVLFVAATASAQDTATATPAAGTTAAEVTRHHLRVRLDSGVALVTEEITLSAANGTDIATHLSLGVPGTARMLALEVCTPRRCRRATRFDDARAIFEAARYALARAALHPLVLASLRGESVALEISGLDPGETLLRVTWSSLTDTLDGVDRLDVPARAATLSIELASATLDALAIDGDHTQRRVSAAQPFVITGQSTFTRPTLEHGRAGHGAWVRATAPRPVPRPMRVVVLVDVSPSAELDRSALDVALASLLGAMHPDSEVHVVAFARHAREIAVGRAADVRTLPLTMPSDLGRSTSAEAAERAVRSVGGEPAIVWLGDGGLSWGAREASAARRLRDAGLEVVTIPNARVDPHLELDVTVLDPSSEPGRRDALARAVLAPRTEVRVGTSLLELRAGRAELVVLPRLPRLSGATPAPIPAEAMQPFVDEGLGIDPDLRDLLTLDPVDRDAARKLARGRLAHFRVGGRIDPPTGALWTRRSRPIVCGRTCTCAVAGGVAREVVQRMIRRTVVPRARACFARERAGRPDWQGRATLVLGFEGPELAFADVETASPALRACILEAAEYLVPPETDDDASQTVVRYVLRSDAIVAPAPELLEEGLRESIDHAFGAEPAIPGLTLLER